jgi:hypothetical protein
MSVSFWLMLYEVADLLRTILFIPDRFGRLLRHSPESVRVPVPGLRAQVIRRAMMTLRAWMAWQSSSFDHYQTDNSSCSFPLLPVDG